MRRSATLPSLWEAMVARVETLHETIVFSQARATRHSALKIERDAADIVALARAVSVFTQKGGQ